MDQRIGKYHLVAKIGEGAMGEVYKAHDPVLNRHVAVKTMSALLTADEELVSRFRREAQSAARLNHPNIVTIFDFAQEEQGRFYMAMELLEGEDLKDVIARNVLSDLWDKLEVMEQICEGLTYAHAHGVIHRDLKPANIRILPNGRVKIMDFGLARLGTSDMTRTGMVMGTPNYMSPEQVRGEKADQRSDIFSLGAVFYELLCGHKAFYAESMHTVLYKVLEEPPDPVQTYAPGLPAPFVAFLDQALQKAPERRYADAEALRAAVRGVREAVASGNMTFAPATSPATATLISDGEATLMETAATHVRPSVTGANALDPARIPAPRTSRSKPPTLSGHAATHGVGRAVPAPPSGSRTPLFVGAGLVLLVVAGVAGTVALRRPASAPPTTVAPDLTREQVLTEELVRSKVDLARFDLESKNYRGAIAAAEEALARDPQSTEARQIREQAEGALKELEAAANQARSAFAQGDTTRASQSLSRVLAIDPRHPVAAELSVALNQHFRGQAQEARQATMEARSQSLRVNPASAAGHADADHLLREAETLFRGGQFTGAAQKFLQARDGFERARRTAEAAARQPSPRAVTAPSVAPSIVIAQNLPTLAPPTTLPPVTAPPTTAPATQAPASSDEPAVRRVIAEYGRAIESRDLALFRTVKPNLSSDEERRLQDAFKAIKSQQVGITIESVQIEGAQAVVRVARQDTINGKPVQRVQQVFRLSQGPGGWAIQSIGQ
jgi:eukaryotic-like serine/threonine-protein kinase